MIAAVLTILVVIFFTICHVSKRKFDYWKKRNIPYLKPVPIFGNYAAYITQRTYMAQVSQSICQKFPNAPYIGTFYGTEPALLVQGPEMVKTVMTKDYYYFNSREISEHSHKEVRTQNLFFTYGDRWKVLRQNLTPIFSTSKMKKMFYLIEDSAHVFENMLDREIKISSVQGVRILMARFTMDAFGSCAFGFDPETMSDIPNNPFTNIGALMFLQTYYRGFKIAARVIWPTIFYGLGMKCFPPEADEFFHKLMKKVFEARQYQPTNRNDFVDQILNWAQEKYLTGDCMQNMKDGNKKKVRLEVNDEILVAQVMVFFAGGYVTSSLTMQYTLYELAKNPEVQDRAITDIDDYLRRHDNQIEYEGITELPFIEACFYEALHLYPVNGMLSREAVEDYTLPCGAVIDKGTHIHIPVYHLHHNPDFFTDPEEFRPDRFCGEEKKNIIPYTHLPFGEGPRTCIGMRFAKMEMFAAIVTILKRYRVEMTEDTPRKLEFTPTTVVTFPRETVKLKFVEREGWQQRQYRRKK